MSVHVVGFTVLLIVVRCHVSLGGVGYPGTDLTYVLILRNQLYIPGIFHILCTHVHSFVYMCSYCTTYMHVQYMPSCIYMYMYSTYSTCSLSPKHSIPFETIREHFSIIRIDGLITTVHSIVRRVVLDPPDLADLWVNPERRELMDSPVMLVHLVLMVLEVWLENRGPWDRRYALLIVVQYACIYMHATLL